MTPTSPGVSNDFQTVGPGGTRVRPPIGSTGELGLVSKAPGANDTKSQNLGTPATLNTQDKWQL